MVGQPYSGRLNVRLDERREDTGNRRLPPTLHCNVFVKSRAAGKRVMASLEAFLCKRLRLKVNREKSAVARPWARKFLGYSFTSNFKPKLKVSPQSVKRLKAKLRPVWKQGRGGSIASTVARLKPPSPDAFSASRSALESRGQSSRLPLAIVDRPVQRASLCKATFLMGTRLGLLSSVRPRKGSPGRRVKPARTRR